MNQLAVIIACRRHRVRRRHHRRVRHHRRPCSVRRPARTAAAPTGGATIALSARLTPAPDALERIGLTPAAIARIPHVPGARPVTRLSGTSRTIACLPRAPGTIACLPCVHDPCLPGATPAIADTVASTRTAVTLELVRVPACYVLTTLVRPSAERFTRIGVLPLPFAEFLLACRIAVADALTMLGVVLPVGVLDIGLIEVVVLVDVHIDVAPAPVAVPPQRTAYDHPCSEGKQSRARHISGWIVGVWRICRVRPWAVGDRRIVGRDIYRLRIGGLDLDDRRARLLFARDGLFLARFEIPAA